MWKARFRLEGRGATRERRAYRAYVPTKHGNAHASVGCTFDSGSRPHALTHRCHQKRLHASRRFVTRQGAASACELKKGMRTFLHCAAHASRAQARAQVRRRVGTQAWARRHFAYVPGKRGAAPPSADSMRLGRWRARACRRGPSADNRRADSAEAESHPVRRVCVALSAMAAAAVRRSTAGKARGGRVARQSGAAARARRAERHAPCPHSVVHTPTRVHAHRAAARCRAGAPTRRRKTCATEQRVGGGGGGGARARGARRRGNTEAAHTQP